MVEYLGGAAYTPGMVLTERSPTSSPAAAPGPGRSGTTLLDRLHRVTGDLQLRLADALAESGDHGLRPSFAPLLQLLRDGPLPIGRVAGGLGVSPQAASRAATTLERLGYVARTPNAADGRSRLVGLTGRGHRLIERAGATLLRCEADYAGLIGRARMDRLLRDLDDVRDAIGPPARRPPVLDAGGHRSVGVVILVTLQAKREVVRVTVDRGHPGIRTSHLELLGAIGDGGARVSDLARLQRVSRQAVSATVQELESLGYLVRRPDEVDRRGVVFNLTARGRGLAADALAVVGAIEARYRAVLGDDRFARFDRTVRALGDGVDRTAPVPADGPRSPAPGGADRLELERLARQLRVRLGPAGAARLAALLAGDAATGGGAR
jgi:DNA-binding MarR family transcriptional regulator